MSLLAAFEPSALELGERLRARGWRLTTAESCTGGLLAAACTAVPGSSDWFEQGWVTYSNGAKTRLLGVSAATLASHGAVSDAVAVEMAQGALAAAAVQLAVSVTGIAGPGGAVPGKPVGTVWLAWALSAPADGGALPDPAASASSGALLLRLAGSRADVREHTVARALELMLGLVAMGRPPTHGTDRA